MFFGATLAAGTIASILGIIFGFISFVVKLKEEERLLTANLGQEYPKYKTSTWAVIPFIY
jgi:protein-S-isoprenylcysteine O-methyltransferase Ste14